MPKSLSFSLSLPKKYMAAPVMGAAEILLDLRTQLFPASGRRRM